MNGDVIDTSAYGPPIVMVSVGVTVMTETTELPAELVVEAVVT